MTDQQHDPEIRMDSSNLYLEESFTDRRVGSVQRLTPVTPAGDPDPSRDVLYLGQTQIVTPGGALPLTFELKASSLDDAIGQFGARAQEALESTMQRLEEMRREAASSLIVPGSSPDMGGRGGPGGGIKLP